MEAAVKKMVYRFVGVVVLVLSQFTLAAGSPLLDSELEQFKKDFSSNDASIAGLFQRLSWTGITDSSLFEMIKARVQNSYMDTNEATVETNAYLVRTLALSGNEKYKEFFTFIQRSEAPKKLRRHAKMAAHRIDGFTRANAIIAQNNEKAVTQDELNKLRISNMIGSTFIEVAGEGARRVNDFYRTDPTLVGEVNKALLDSYKGAFDDESIDALTWMCRVLGNSGYKEYKSTLNEISANASAHKKVRSAAKKYAAYLN